MPEDSMGEQWLVHILMLAVGVGMGAFTAAWKMRSSTESVHSAQAVAGNRMHRTEDDIIEIKLELKDLNRKLDMYALLVKSNGRRIEELGKDR